MWLLQINNLLSRTGGKMINSIKVLLGYKGTTKTTNILQSNTSFTSEQITGLSNTLKL